MTKSDKIIIAVFLAMLAIFFYKAYRGWQQERIIMERLRSTPQD